MDGLGNILKVTVHFSDWDLGGRLAVGADWIFGPHISPLFFPRRAAYMSLSGTCA